jgi:phenylalanyl-tRNA synthetase beta chain
MPTITLNRNVVEKLSGVKLPDAELKERIAMLGTDLEELTKTEINVEIFPNRPDLLSEQGFARALASFAGKKTGLRKYNAKKSSYKMIIDDSVKNVRPYTACAVVKNLKFDEEKIEEIIKIQEKLHVTYGRNRKKVAIGIYPLDKITFPITFKADKPEKIIFQPLEARKMTAV